MAVMPSDVPSRGAARRSGLGPDTARQRRSVAALNCTANFLTCPVSAQSKRCTSQEERGLATVSNDDDKRHARSDVKHNASHRIKPFHFIFFF